MIDEDDDPALYPPLPDPGPYYVHDGGMRGAYVIKAPPIPTGSPARVWRGTGPRASAAAHVLSLFLNITAREVYPERVRALLDELPPLS